MLSNVKIISGIHGVGKTTICKEICSKTNIKSYTCSGLIKIMDNDIIDDSVKTVKDISKNQNILLKAIDKYIIEETIILDSHFCLIDSNNCIKRIPIDTFIKLPISIIIVVTRKPEEIVSSIYNRDNENYDIKFIEKFQEEEIAYGKKIAELLNVQYIEYNFSEPLENLIKLIS